MLKAGEDYAYLEDGELRTRKEKVLAGDIINLRSRYGALMVSVQIKVGAELWVIERLTNTDHGGKWKWEMKEYCFYENDPLEGFLKAKKDREEEEQAYELAQREAKKAEFARDHAKWTAREKVIRERDEAIAEKKHNRWYKRVYRSMKKSPLPKARVVKS